MVVSFVLLSFCNGLILHPFGHRLAEVEALEHRVKMRTLPVALDLLLAVSDIVVVFAYFLLGAPC